MLVKRILNVGAQTCLVHFVQNVEDVAAANAATRYALDGIRGVAGGTRVSRYWTCLDLLTTASAEVYTIVQVETRAALNQIEAICAGGGADGFFVAGNIDQNLDLPPTELRMGRQRVSSGECKRRYTGRNK